MSRFAFVAGRWSERPDLLMPLTALPFIEIDPVLIEFGPFAIRWYSLAYITGILFAWFYAKRLASRSFLSGKPGGVTHQDLDDFVLWATIGIVLGGRLGYVLFYNFFYYVDHPQEIIAVWTGGMSFHGGFAGVTLAMIAFAWRRGLNIWSLFDVVAAGIPVGLGLGRLANFINSELWGRVADVPWAFVFPTGGPDPRHPSQLYEALLEGLVLFALLRLLIVRFDALSRPGVVASLFVAGYGVSRFIVEFFREPDPQIGFVFGWMTMGMILSTPMILIGAGFAWQRWRNAEKTV